MIFNEVAIEDVQTEQLSRRMRRAGVQPLKLMRSRSYLAIRYPNCWMLQRLDAREIILAWSETHDILRSLEPETEFFEVYPKIEDVVDTRNCRWFWTFDLSKIGSL